MYGDTRRLGSENEPNSYRVDIEIRSSHHPWGTAWYAERGRLACEGEGVHERCVTCRDDFIKRGPSRITIG
ncbi:MAG: hypothetical protein HBSAPP03_06620 [Phycisphaerae bacterium]|nr:MAG: hypothetical protein HBSAPP03_06620 [Phycisphaerae bacterium]